MNTLAFDQTLASTGWVFIVDGRTQCTGTIKTPVSAEGHLGNLKRATLVHREASSLMHLHRPHVVVMEMPITRTAAAHRAESSLMAAEAVWIAAEEWGARQVLISAQRMKRRLCGVAGADKQAVRAAIQARIPGIENHRPYNEHVVDAIALALVAAEEGLC